MTDSGLPSDATVAERQAEYAARQEKHSERVERIVQAFTQLPTAPGRGDGPLGDKTPIDLAEYLRRSFADLSTGDHSVPVELTLAEVEAISLRIAELNQMVMQGGMVLDEASIRREAAEVERLEREATLAAKGVAEGTVARDAAIIAREKADAHSSVYADRMAAAVEARKLRTPKTPDSPL